MCLMVLTLYMLVLGVLDIRSTYQQTYARNSILTETRENGETEVHVTKIVPSTKYPAVSGLKDVDSDPAAWPNISMEQYWQIEKIIGNE